MRSRNLQWSHPLPSPRGVRVASWWQDQGWHRCSVAVPARGAGCIEQIRETVDEVLGCRPREGCGLHLKHIGEQLVLRLLPSPRGVRVASSLFRSGGSLLRVGCRPREGCGLHQQKDTNPYQHICRFHTTRRLSITQGQQKMQGVLCLLYRKRECNLIVGSANRLFLRDKNAREKQRLAGNC